MVAICFNGFENKPRTHTHTQTLSRTTPGQIGLWIHISVANPPHGPFVFQNMQKTVSLQVPNHHPNWKSRRRSTKRSPKRVQDQFLCGLQKNIFVDFL